jgi:general stress protein 26
MANAAVFPDPDASITPSDRRREVPKIRHLRHEPQVSLTYWDAEQDNVHVEAVATVVADQADPSRIWDLFAGTDPPLGYDRAMFWPSKTDPAFALLRLEPSRIELTGLRHRSSGRQPLIWRPLAERIAR